MIYDLIFMVIFNSIVALCIAIPMGTLHEYLHIRKAKSLGLKVTSYSLKRNEVCVDVDDPKLDKQIREAPYIVIVPISLLILGLGFYFMQLGLIVGGLATIVINGIHFKKEGRDVKKK